jgi:hypothetical protein
MSPASEWGEIGDRNFSYPRFCWEKILTVPNISTDNEEYFQIIIIITS